MTTLDHVLQRWRIRKALRFVPRGARLLDVGCSNAKLFDLSRGLAAYVGLDPEPRAESRGAGMQVVKGQFPRDAPTGARFDAITVLAAFEHVPAEEQGSFVQACYAALDEGGVVVLTVPDPKVDRILDVLQAARLIDGIEIHQHYGYDVTKTPDVFRRAGFELAHHGRFQLGLNNLFVFRKPSRA